MIAVLHKEWKRFFHSLRGYLFLGIYVLLVGLFVTVYNFIYGSGSVESVMDLLLVGVALLLPLVTVPLWGDERRSGGTRLLRMLPLSEGQIFWGKYLFGVSVLGLMTAILALCPVVLSFYTEINVLSTVLGLLGFLLAAHTVMVLGLCLSVCLKQTAVAWVVTYGALGVLTVLRALASTFVGIPRTVLEYLSVIGAFKPFSMGLLDLRSTVLWITLSCVLLAISANCARRERMN